eukprot:SM000028S10155  [mRNA]  locus=s28:586638:586876:+ [translate_table: standard]
MAARLSPSVGTGGPLVGQEFLKRAQELKGEGNARFAARDLAGALEAYAAALRLTPARHPDRALLHRHRTHPF